MTWIIGILLYLLIGSIVFISVLEGNNQADSKVLFLLASPFIILGYPYYLLKRIIK